MATDGFALPLTPARAHFAPWVAEAAFVGLLLLVFVGLEPFQVRDAATLADVGGSGSVARQVCYLLVFAASIVAAYDRRALDSAAAVPLSLVLLLGWCFLSASWAGEPGVAFRRAGLEFVIVSSAMLGVSTLGTERALRLWYYVLAGVLIVNWIAIPTIPQAIHLPGEADPSLVGDWRGLYFQKNITGAVCAISTMIFLHFYLRKRNWIDLGLIVAAIGFLVMTRSKSSLGFLPLALLAGAAYRWAWKRDIDRLIVTFGVLLLLVLIGGFIASHTAEIARIMQNPDDFTGRTQIWQAELGYIHDHPLFGAGYGTFADTGGQSPLHNYIDAKWVATVPHGHNGYLQLLVTIGGIGFSFAMLAFLVMPFARLWPRDPENLALKSLLFSIFVFVVVHNLLESDYLEGAGPAWLALLIVIAMLHSLRPHRLVWRGGGGR